MRFQKFVTGTGSKPRRISFKREPTALTTFCGRIPPKNWRSKRWLRNGRTERTGTPRRWTATVAGARVCLHLSWRPIVHLFSRDLLLTKDPTNNIARSEGREKETFVLEMLFELPVFYGQTVKLVEMKVGVKIRFTLPRFAKYKRRKLAYERKKKNLFIDTTRLPWMEALDIRRRQI